MHPWQDHHLKEDFVAKKQVINPTPKEYEFGDQTFHLHHDL